MRLKSRWQISAIGVLLGFTPLFRRHFAYAVIAFLAAMSLQTLIEAGSQWRDESQQALRDLVNGSLRIGAVAIVGLGTIVILGKHFVVRILHNDFSSLYRTHLRSS